MDRHGLEADTRAGLRQKVQTAHESIKRAGDARNALVGFALDSIHRHLKIARWIFPEKLDVSFIQKRGVGEDGDQQAHAFEQEEYFGKIGAQKRLAAGDQAPHRTELHCLGGNGGDLRDSKLPFPGSAITRRQIDVAVAAVIVAPRRDFNFKGNGSPFRFELVPERIFLDLKHFGF